MVGGYLIGDGPHYEFAGVRVCVVGDCVLVVGFGGVKIYGVGEWFTVFDLSLVLNTDNRLVSESHPFGSAPGLDEACRRYYLTQFCENSRSGAIDETSKALVRPVAAMLYTILRDSPWFTPSEVLAFARLQMADGERIRVSRWMNRQTTGVVRCLVGEAGVWMFCGEGMIVAECDFRFDGHYVPFSRLGGVYPFSLEYFGNTIRPSADGWGAWGLCVEGSWVMSVSGTKGSRFSFVRPVSIGFCISKYLRCLSKLEGVGPMVCDCFDIKLN